MFTEVGSVFGKSYTGQKPSYTAGWKAGKQNLELWTAQQWPNQTNTMFSKNLVMLC